MIMSDQGERLSLNRNRSCRFWSLCPSGGCGSGPGPSVDHDGHGPSSRSRLAGVVRLFDRPAPYLSLRVQSGGRQCGDEVEESGTGIRPQADVGGRQLPGLSSDQLRARRNAAALGDRRVATQRCARAGSLRPSRGGGRGLTKIVRGPGTSASSRTEDVAHPLFGVRALRHPPVRSNERPPCPRPARSRPSFEGGSSGANPICAV